MVQQKSYISEEENIFIQNKDTAARIEGTNFNNLLLFVIHFVHYQTVSHSHIRFVNARAVGALRSEEHNLLKVEIIEIFSLPSLTITKPLLNSLYAPVRWNP